MKDRFVFKIPIGDQCADGHGRCNYFEASIVNEFDHPLKTLKEAYELAKQKLPKFIHPDQFCDGYEDYSVPEKVLAEIKKRGGPEQIDNTQRWFALYVCWFLNQGYDFNSLDAKLSDPIPSFGPDTFGYGLFGG